VTEFGIFSVHKEEHPEKQKLLRDVTEFGIFSDDKEEHIKITVAKRGD
jgi:hypothetical protein